LEGNDKINNNGNEFRIINDNEDPNFEDKKIKTQGDD
jgi:hypothetical protein